MHNKNVYKCGACSLLEVIAAEVLFLNGIQMLLIFWFAIGYGIWFLFQPGRISSRILLSHISSNVRLSYDLFKYIFGHRMFSPWLKYHSVYIYCI